ncbi:hypothetical protein E2C01_069069 [Portunus trituberculatus]|uniref:Uncharacterized protein n=1 Tax=Portunus trituberculatus TaxID=210409 RepID=A0A5B7HY88_PORTR|nr:hypothetical protein [Portunus trituberculatus]
MNFYYKKVVVVKQGCPGGRRAGGVAAGLGSPPAHKVLELLYLDNHLHLHFRKIVVESQHASLWRAKRCVTPILFPRRPTRHCLVTARHRHQDQRDLIRHM